MFWLSNFLYNDILCRGLLNMLDVGVLFFFWEDFFFNCNLRVCCFSGKINNIVVVLDWYFIEN